MSEINLKSQTVKIPRSLLSPAARTHMLDVLLACISQSIGEHGDAPLRRHERAEYEHYIANSHEVSPRVKAALAQLSETERAQLFR